MTHKQTVAIPTSDISINVDDRLGNIVSRHHYLHIYHEQCENLTPPKITASTVAISTYQVPVVPVPAWRSGNTLDSINVVTLSRARLVPGWVTVFGRVNHLDTELGTQVDSA